MLGRLQRGDMADLLAGAAAGGCPDPAVWHTELVAIRARLDQFALDYAEGLLDRDQLRVAGGRERARLREVQDRIAAAGRVDVVAPLVAADGMDAAWRVWSGYPISTRREVISRLLRVEVLRVSPGRPRVGAGFDPGTVRLSWRDAGSDGV